MENLNWKATEEKAKRMSNEALHYAIQDCLETARIMGAAPMHGKDAGFYTDEASVYRREQARRK